MNLKVKLAIASTLILSTGFFLTGNTLTSTPITVKSENIISTNKTEIKNEIEIATKSVDRLSIPSSQIVEIKGEIRSNASVIADEIKLKGKSNSELYLLIDSPGGSVMDGALIISAMEASPAKVHTVCVGMCASMAFMIHQYGVKRLAVDRSVLMAHPASGGVQGTLEQMQSRLYFISRYVEKMDLHVAARMKISLQEYKALTVSEYWIDAEDGISKHLVDGIVDVSTEGQPIFKIPELPSEEHTSRLNVICE